LALAGCGGGNSSSGGSATCDVAAQDTWLRSYMLDKYYWSGTSPSPDPSTFTTVQSYFDAQRFAGSAAVPFDRWSYIQDSASYTQFFAEGMTLGYGIFVNGVELQLPLRVRFVEAASPAAAVLARGDTVLSVNGRSAADLIAANDFADLTPARQGDVLTLQIDSGTGPRTVTLTAATYALTPVPTSAVLTRPSGAKVGYLVLKDFITQAEAPLVNALASFRAAGATELIIDLRYNGGGRISTANVLTSLIAGASNNGKVFAHLNYNAAHASSNGDFRLAGGTGAAFSRVVVLTGQRTCSASELVVNGLKPYTQVVTVGAASCGKPFGFNPVTNCGSTISAVNFETFNAQGQGSYYDGIAPTCPVNEDFTGALGSSTEKLTAAATDYLQTGSCPAIATAERSRASAISHRARLEGIEPGERQGMWAESPP
jgi:carboxyl-terminal processing protease